MELRVRAEDSDVYKEMIEFGPKEIERSVIVRKGERALRAHAIGRVVHVFVPPEAERPLFSMRSGDKPAAIVEFDAIDALIASGVTATKKRKREDEGTAAAAAGEAEAPKAKKPRKPAKPPTEEQLAQRRLNRQKREAEKKAAAAKLAEDGGKKD